VLKDILSFWVKKRLIFKEEDKYLSLAINWDLKNNEK
jgi:hypothetical protein